MEEPVVIELGGGHEPDLAQPRRGYPRVAAVAVGLAALVSTAALAAVLVGDEQERAARDAPPTSRPVSPFGPIPEVGDAQRLADPQLAAACYAAEPSGPGLRALFESIGGFDGLGVGVAIGAFDIVSFDAGDPDRLLASQRGGYGLVENQHDNQQWRIGIRRTEQTEWNPSTPHDFAHFNTDGTVTMWVHSGDPGLAPRIAVVLDGDGEVVTRASAPMHADRFAVDSGTIFALTGEPDWYAPRDVGYRALVADDGERQVALAPGEAFGWIDVPAPGILAAYPVDGSGVTALWDTTTLEPLVGHPLAGRPYERVAISGDGTTAVAVTFDGELEPVDLVAGRTGSRFGRVDVREVDRPLVLSADGTVAYTVERSGRVSIWFVGDDVPVATVAGGAGVPRWLPTSRSAARLTSALAPDGSRLALRVDARPGVSVSWRMIDTDVESWLERARAMAPGPTDLRRC